MWKYCVIMLPLLTAVVTGFLCRGGGGGGGVSVLTEVDLLSTPFYYIPSTRSWGSGFCWLAVHLTGDRACRVDCSFMADLISPPNAECKPDWSVEDYRHTHTPLSSKVRAETSAGSLPGECFPHKGPYAILHTASPLCVCKWINTINCEPLGGLSEQESTW